MKKPEEFCCDECDYGSLSIKSVVDVDTDQNDLIKSLDSIDKLSIVHTVSERDSLSGKDISLEEEVATTPSDNNVDTECEHSIDEGVDPLVTVNNSSGKKETSTARTDEKKGLMKKLKSQFMQKRTLQTVMMI